MIQNKLKKHSNRLLIFLILSIFYSVNSYAVYDNSRAPNVSWNASNSMCQTGSIDYDPLTGGNKDLEWKIDNPSCSAFAASFGAAIVLAGFYVSNACIATNQIGVAKAAAEKAGDPIPDSPFITPNTGYKMLYRSSVLCANRVGEYGTLQGTAVAACAVPGAQALCANAQAQVALSASDATRCCTAYTMYAKAVGVGLSALAITHSIANKTFQKARICGHDWQVWKKFDENGEETTKGNRWRRGSYDDSYQNCIESIFVDNINKCNLKKINGVDVGELSVQNKYYREFIYGGKEFRDKGGANCKNPTSWDRDKRIETLGYADNDQRYYMKGSAKASNYACHRFLASANPKFDLEANEAYECCKRRSQNTVCIENANAFNGDKYTHEFCRYGSRCDVGGVTFEIFRAKSDESYLCAKTYTVCPYDHLLGGGTEVAEYAIKSDGQPSSRIKNFCQVYNHCAKVPVLPYIRMSNLNGAFIEKSCRDMKGDSQNVYNYSAEILPLNNLKSFSAPIAQCFKETVQNMMLNKAGHSKCLDPDESPNQFDECESGYHFARGEKLKTPSPFEIVQNALRTAIKIVMSLSITFFGAMTLLGMQPIKRKQISIFAIKFSVIMYFALGTGWQDFLIDGILETSTSLGDIMMQVDELSGFVGDPNSLTEREKNERLDGCQFPKFNYKKSVSDPDRFNNKSYPPGLEYLKIWDALDCKLVKSLGFGPDLTVPNLLLTIVAGLLTGGLGIIFVMGTLCFAFFFLSIILRALHVFLISTIALVLLIYISPITLTCALFQKTKEIFDNWLKQLIGFILQPVILFAYLGIFISIFNVVIVGDIKYKGDGLKAPKQVICDSKTKDTSMYCIFRVADFRSYTGLEPIGVTIPVLTSMNREKMISILNAALMMFIFSKFMDQVATIAYKLVGGQQIQSDSPGAGSIASKSYNTSNAVRQRGTRVAARAGVKALGVVGAKSKITFRALGSGGSKSKKGHKNSSDEIGGGGGGKNSNDSG